MLNCFSLFITVRVTYHLMKMEAELLIKLTYSNTDIKVFEVGNVSYSKTLPKL